MFFSGHSMGGVVSTITAARIRQGTPARKISYLTFGSPKPGDQRLSDVIGSFSGTSLVNDTDLITVLPPDRLTLTPVEIALGVPTLFAWVDWVREPNRIEMDAMGQQFTNESPVLDFATLLSFATTALDGGAIATIFTHSITEYRRRLSLRCPRCGWPLSAELCALLNGFVPLPEQQMILRPGIAARERIVLREVQEPIGRIVLRWFAIAKNRMQLDGFVLPLPAKQGMILGGIPAVREGMGLGSYGWAREGMGLGSYGWAREGMGLGSYGWAREGMGLGSYGWAREGMGLGSYGWAREGMGLGSYGWAREGMGLGSYGWAREGMGLGSYGWAKQAQVLGAYNLPKQQLRLLGTTLPKQQLRLRGTTLPKQSMGLGAYFVPKQRMGLGSYSLPKQQLRLRGAVPPKQRMVLNSIAPLIPVTQYTLGSATSGNAAATSLTLTVTVKAGILIVAALTEGGVNHAGTATCKFGSTTMGLTMQYYGGGVAGRLHLFHLAVSAGTQTITLTPQSSVAQFLMLQAINVTGLASNVPYNTGGGIGQAAGTSSAPTSVSSSTSALNQYLICATCCYGLGSGYGWATGFNSTGQDTSQIDGSNTVSLNCASNISGTSGPYQPKIISATAADWDIGFQSYH